MKDFLKKQPIGIYAMLALLLFTIISFSIYGAGVGSDGYFHNRSVDIMVTTSSLAIVFEILIIAYMEVKVLGFVDKLPSIVAKLLEVVCDVLKVLIPVLFTLAIFTFIDTRVEGLAFIFFSNIEILPVIQTPETLASASLAITTMVMYAITIVVGVVAAFFSVAKKQKAVAAEAQA